MGTLRPRLHVMLDTNALYARSDGDSVVAASIEQAITDPAHLALNVLWCIPQMVQMEREYHLWQNTKHAVSAAAKVPKVFANSWILDSEAVRREIRRVVTSALSDLGIQIIDCDLSLVDWKSLIQAAGHRLPPFDPDSEREKGFKDAIIAETFVQFCKGLDHASGETALLVSDDMMLRQHVSARVNGMGCRALADLASLRNELNFLASDIEAGTAEELQEQALNLLDQSFLETVSSSLTEQIEAKKLTAETFFIDIQPAGFRVSPPVFVTKQNRRAYFSLKITVLRKGKMWVYDAPNVGTGGLLQLDEKNYYWKSEPPQHVGASPIVPHTITVPLWDKATYTPPNERFFSFGGTSPVKGGRYEEVPLSSFIFDVAWTATLDVVDGKVHLLPGTARIESVTFEQLGPAETPT